MKVAIAAIVRDKAAPGRGGTPRATAKAGLRRWWRRHWPPGRAEKDGPVLRWELDYPSAKRPPWFSHSGRVVQGWILLSRDLAQALPRVRVVAEWQPSFELCHPLEVARPDVIEKVLAEPAAGHPLRVCGFRFTVPHRLKHFRLWLELEGKRWPLRDVRVEDEWRKADRVTKVLEGRSGWLFLDNDTNGSVDQFTGRLRLTPAGVTAWQHYLSGAHDLAQRQRMAWALLVAPSKESVVGGQYHPRRGGQGGPMAQVMALPEAATVVYPVAALQALGDAAFIPTDTHWTHRGAMTAAVALAEHLGLDARRCRATLAKDRYKSREMGGDLGNKLVPRKTSRVAVLTSFGHARHRTYDNGLPNFGRLLVMEYPDPVAAGTCLLFGSSSSYSMFHFLCRFFRRLVFVHSAGNLDPTLVASVRPDFLVAQTNARFVVQVPELNQSLSRLIHDKVARLTAAERELVADRRIAARADYLAEVGISQWETDMQRAWGGWRDDAGCHG